MENYCLVVSKNSLKETRRYISQLDISDPSRRLQSNLEDHTIAVPISIKKIQKLSGNIDDKDDSCQIIFDYLSRHLSGQEFSVKRMKLPLAKKLNIKKPETKLKESLQVLFEKKGLLWSQAIATEIPSHWERHGDLILIPSSFISPVWKELGNALWECVTSCLLCKRIAVKDVVSTNGYRSPQVRLLYGDDSWVVQTDNGIKYTYDITKCMFSSGNITEKLRVANFDCTDEIVVDLYAGIGYFTLPYLVYTNVKHLHACEWNPDAVEALRMNLMLNKVEDKCTVHQGDNREVCPKRIADRVNLGLIPSSRDGWPVACAALNPLKGGVLHIHHNVNTKTKASYDNDQELLTHYKDQFLCEDKLIGSKDISAKETSFDAGKFADSDTPNETTSKGIVGVCEQISTLKVTSKYSKWLPWAQEVSMEIKTILEELHNNDWETNILHIEHVKSYAPHVDHVVLDLECRP